MINSDFVTDPVTFHYCLFSSALGLSAICFILKLNGTAMKNDLRGVDEKQKRILKNAVIIALVFL